MLVAAWGIGAANDLFFVVSGAWFEQVFHLSVLEVGFSATVIGIAELLGESLTSLIGDRLGLARAIILGLIGSGVSYALLPLAGQVLTFALIMLFVMALSVEFTIVTALSFATEILPDARATMMSGFMFAISLGRVGGALGGGLLWRTGGMWAICLVAASISGLVAIMFWWGRQHHLRYQ
jgi:predicted MFS family arabinose efflux permease